MIDSHSEIRLTGKHCIEECSQWRDNRRNYDLEELLGKNCQVGKLMNFLKEIGLSEDI